MKKFKIGDIVDCKSDTAERNGKPVEYVGRNMYGVATDMFYEHQMKLTENHQVTN